MQSDALSLAVYFAISVTFLWTNAPRCKHVASFCSTLFFACRKRLEKTPCYTGGVPFIFNVRLCLCVQMCFEWFTKGQHDLESDVQQQLFKEKILKLEPYEITMNGERRRRRLSPLLSL